MKQPVLLFLHLPRAGGTTLTEVLLRQYPAEAVYLIHSGRAAESMERFAALGDAEKARYRLIRGHMLFGLHEAVPGESTYMTFFRDPVDRVISHYMLEIKRGKLPKMDTPAAQLAHFVEHCETRNYMLNLQTRFLAGDRSSLLGDSYDPVAFAGTQDGWLDLALSHLENHFQVYGLTERFDESLLLLQRRFGWRSVYYRRLNTSENRLRRADLPAATLARIEADNALDMALVEHAASHFEAQVAAVDAGFAAGLAGQVARFRRRNSLFSRLTSVTEGLRRRAARLRGLAASDRGKDASGAG